MGERTASICVRERERERERANRRRSEGDGHLWLAGPRARLSPLRAVQLLYAPNHTRALKGYITINVRARVRIVYIRVYIVDIYSTPTEGLVASTEAERERQRRTRTLTHAAETTHVSLSVQARDLNWAETACCGRLFNRRSMRARVYASPPPRGYTYDDAATRNRQRPQVRGYNQSARRWGDGRLKDEVVLAVVSMRRSANINER